jgi:Mn-dependent DtxR family transcriptional regulator
MAELTIAMENYLEAVYESSFDGVGSRVSDIAVRLGVSKASVNNAMNILAKKGLDENEKYREVKLTPAGREMAEVVSNRHAIIFRVFSEVLGIPEDIADTDACAIEHVISGESVQRMNDFLKCKK